MSRVVLDTDAASTLLRGGDDPRLRRYATGAFLGVTFVTVGELTKWTAVRDLGPDREDELREFLDTLAVVPYQREIAECWGHLQASAQKRGRPRPINDSWIAACCIVNDVPLLTFNTKDFVDFAEHDGLHLLS